MPAHDWLTRIALERNLATQEAEALTPPPIGPSVGVEVVVASGARLYSGRTASEARRRSIDIMAGVGALALRGRGERRRGKKAGDRGPRQRNPQRKPITNSPTLAPKPASASGRSNKTS